MMLFSKWSVTHFVHEHTHTCIISVSTWIQNISVWFAVNWTKTHFFFFFVDLVDIAVYRSELFCLHGSGRLSHLSLLSAERCVERLLRRESWPLAAAVCCMFQHAITTGRVRWLLLPCYRNGSCPYAKLNAFSSGILSKAGLRSFWTDLSLSHPSQ